MGGEQLGGVELRVLCWDHPRCVDPVTAAVAVWERSHPEIHIDVRARPLAAFNDQPVPEIASTADVLFVDHPMVGTAAQTQALVPLEDLLDAEVLAALTTDSIGGSQESYVWEGRQWATAVDAACQVAVRDERRLRDLGPTPQSWTEVLDLARRAPGSVAIPLYPSDAVLSLVSMSEDLRRCGAADAEEMWPREAIATLCELAGLVDPRSFQVNPPQLLDLMSTGPQDDAPLYAPLLFGYTNYQRPTARGRRLSFCAPPAFGDRPAAVLGGAGLAVSAFSEHPSEAAAFAAWMSGTETQRDVVLPAEGQPSSRAVWVDPEADALVGGFFSGTRSTIESSHVRPRDSWWPAYQEAAGIALVQALRAETAPDAIRDDLDRLLATARDKELNR
jgi:multiple sugar transport system substrate-binding protein